MEDINTIQELIIPFLPFILLFILWEGIWKLFCLAIINTMGVLPILYLLFVKKKNTP